VLSQDGHPVSGSLTFAVGAPTDGTVAVPGGDDGTLGPVRTGLQVLAYASALLAAGLVVLAALVLPGAARPAALRRTATIACGVASAAGLLLVPVTRVITRAGGVRDLIRAHSWSGPGAGDQWLAWGLLSVGLAVGLGAPTRSARRERLRALVVLLARRRSRSSVTAGRPSRSRWWSSPTSPLPSPGP
jgi:copper transport protein